jgi:tetratricopeptide (TPR) repeat protein
MTYTETAPDAETTAAGADGADPAPGRRRRPLRWVLTGVVAGCAVLGGAVYALLPDGPPPGTGVQPGPAGRAEIAAAVGAPAALPDLAALIRDREAAVRARPRDPAALAALGAAYVERGVRTARPADLPRAERALRDSLAARPRNNPAAVDGLAALAVARGDWHTARDYAEQGRKLTPRGWAPYAYLVDAAQGLGDAKAAGANLERLTELASGTAMTLRTVSVYRDRGWREDAEALLSDAEIRAGTPTEQAVLLARGGDLARERGDAAGALRHYDAALAVAADTPEALAGRGRALAALGRSSEALQAYGKAVELRPEPEYVLELGELYESLGMRDAARGQYEALRESADVVTRGRCEADHGDARAAVAALRAEYRRAPNLEVADALGWALHRAGDDRGGLPLLARATDRQKAGTLRSASRMYHLAVVEAALGQPDRARRHVDEALRIDPAFSPLDAPRARSLRQSLPEQP